MKSLIASSLILVLSGCNDGYESSKVGNSLGNVVLTGDTIVGSTLSATVNDANNVTAENITYTWMAGDTVISGASASSYVLLDADIGSEITVSVSYTDDDGFNEVAKSTPTDEVEAVPVNTAGTVAITGNAYVDSVLNAAITDPNGTGSNAITYTWMADGSDIADATAATLTLTDAHLGSVITVSVVYTDNDDFDEAIVSAATDAVTEEPADIVKTNAAAITDTMGTGIGDGTKDTGELRLKLSDIDIDPLESGKLTVLFKKSGDATNNNPNDTDTDNKDAYIGLYGSSTNSGYDLVELRIQEGGYVVRNQDGITVADTFTDEDWVSVEMTWDASSATETAGPMITMSIDGNAVSASAFPTLDSGKDGSFASIMDGVQHLVLKMGDNDATVAATFYIDDIKLYSDVAGTTLVFEDNFDDDYSTGDSLDSDNDASPYNSSTNEAVVEEVNAPVEEAPGASNLQTAEITDTMGTGIGDGTKDTGELRLKLDDIDIDPLATGKLSVSFRKSGDATNNNPNDTDTDNKDAYIGVYGSSTNSGYDLVELRIQEGGYVVRNQDDIDVADTFTDTDWVDVEITWDATSATDSTGPMITMSINGNAVSADAFPTLDSGKDGAFASIMDGAQHLVFKISDNDATVAASFYIDDIKLYSDVAGTNLVFEDDFEADSYAVGDSLDSDNDASPYNSSTNEAVVADRP